MDLITLIYKYGIPYKEYNKDLVILCPFCLEEGKHKIKLWIHKSKLIWHCFRCGKKGSVRSLPYVLNKLGIPYSETYSVISDLIIQSIYELDDLDNTSINYKNDLKYIINIYKHKAKELRKYLEVHSFSLSNLKMYKNDIIKINKKLYNYKNYVEVERQIFNFSLFNKLNKNKVYYGKSDKLDDRIILLTYFGTNFEARSIKNENPKYLKFNYNWTKNINNHKNDSNINNIDNFLLPDFVLYEISLLDIDNNNKTEESEVFVVEGVFDAFKLYYSLLLHFIFSSLKLEIPMKDNEVNLLINFYKDKLRQIYNNSIRTVLSEFLIRINERIKDVSKILIVSLSGYTNIYNLMTFLDIYKYYKKEEFNIDVSIKSVDVILDSDANIDNLQRIIKKTLFEYGNTYNISIYKLKGIKDFGELKII